MIRTVANKAAAAVLKPLGLQLQRVSRPAQARPSTPDPNADPNYTLFRYLDERGEFDYGRYRAAQEAANKRKIDNVWAQPANMKLLADYMSAHGLAPTFGLCHGTRRGLEQQWFSEHLGCPVIGTEISETATEFPNTIQWDFHEAKPEWLGAADFVYSNSFDHAYDPAKALDAWVSCLKPNGMVIIEHTSGHVAADETDPFGAPLQVMPYLVLKWGGGRYSVREIIEAPEPSKVFGQSIDVWFLIITKT